MFNLEKPPGKKKKYRRKAILPPAVDLATAQGDADGRNTMRDEAGGAGVGWSHLSCQDGCGWQH